MTEDILAVLAEHDGNYQASADAMGISYSTFQSRVYNARVRAKRGDAGGPPIPEIAKPPDGFVVSRNAGEYDADGNLRRQWVGTKPDSGDAYTVPIGHVVKGESALLDPDGRVLAKWIKTTKGAAEGLIDGLKEAFAAYDGKAAKIPKPTATDGDLLTEYPIPDLHLGALAWAKETGEAYDIPIAIDIATRAIESLVDQARPSADAVLLFLGDFTHANDQKAVTPGSGHRLDVDSRWPRAYAAAARLAVRMVEIAARKHDTVRVKFLPGNHDIDAAVTITVALSLFFSNNPRIIIDDSPAIAWFHRHGLCLLGGTHGHTMKPEAMAMIMAVDRAEDWGKTIFRHMAYGHVHHENMKEIMGVRVESFQALAARDAWNTERGYRAGRSLSAITWHKQLGEIGRHRVNIPAMASA